jgi:DNA mismatch repair protein MutL
MTHPIQKLPPGVVNKIAAGEVIERPASVVKELLENAIDSGARRIDLSVEKGGRDLIRVTDDGSGIAPDQLPLAVASHATSKIRSADDLFRIGTLGFRGEALASIAEVSRFAIRSRPHDATAGAELEVQGGEIGAVKPCGVPPGTTVEVRHLFFNTPVRQKFLRTTQTEMGHIIEAFTRVALAHHNVHMTLHHNDRPVHDLPPTDRWLERIRSFYGGELGDSLIWLESRDEQVELSGYVADPSCSRGNNKMQYLMLNGRFIRDRSLQHALSEAYRGLLLTGRYPIAFLRLEVPPETVDVNVHPAKMEVRFADGGRLYSQLLGTLRNKFLTTDLTARAKLQTPASSESTFGSDPQQVARHRQQTVQWARGEMTAHDTTGSGRGPTASQSSRSVPEFHPFGESSQHLSPSSASPSPMQAGGSWRSSFCHTHRYSSFRSSARRPRAANSRPVFGDGRRSWTGCDRPACIA